MNKRFLSRLAVTATLALACQAVAAEDAPDYAADTLSGDWNGLRSDWYTQGIALDLGYKWDMLRVTQGGLRRGGRPIGQFDLKAKTDLEKIAGWEGASAYVNFIHDGGGKINRDHLGSQLGISNIEVPVSTTRFFHAWFEQSFDEGRISLLGGLYPIDSEFQVLESAGLFVQPPYGPTPDISLTRGPSIFNNPALGVRAKWISADRTRYAQAAVLDGIPGDPVRPKGTHIKFNKGDGTMQIVEFGFKPEERGHIMETATPEKGLPMSPEAEDHRAADRLGKYALGFWRYTATVDDLVDVDAAGNPEQRRSSGWYVLTEHTLWRWATGDLAGFFRFGSTDGNSTAIKDVYDLGVRVRGLLPGRADDVFGLAYTRGGIGAKFRTSQAAAGITATAAESATELTYRFQATKWLAVQPLLQWYRNPGADAAVPNATVVGARVEFAL